MLPGRHVTIADYLTTIRRLFRDCPATIPGTRREPRGNLRAVPERGRAALMGAKPGGRALGMAAGGASSEGSRQRRGSASTGENVGNGIKAARECLYLRRNCPLNARLCFRGIPIYPRYKRAVYARFRGYFAAAQKIAPENAGALCGAVGTLRRWAALVGLEARRSCRRSEYLQRVQPPTAGAGDTPPSRRQRKAPAGFEPIGAGVYLELFAASMSIKNGMSRIYNRITRPPPPRALSPRAPSFRGRGGGG